MSEKAGVLGPELGLEGVVSNRELSEQAGEQVLQFVVKRQSPEPMAIELPAETVAVELRGEKLYGTVADGQRVALVLPRDFDKQEDRTLRPQRLKNLTTGAVVRASTPGLWGRALRAGAASGKEAWRTLITVGVTAVATLVLVSIGVMQPQSGDVDAGSERSVETLLVIEAVLLALSAVAVFFAYRRWRWTGGPFPLWWSVGYVIGGVIVGVALWYAFTG